jgi:hypothetical protein
MTDTEHGCHHSHASWEELGRTAERFARRVADDAKLFAERVEEHVGEFARDVRREWRESGPRDSASADDVHRMFDEVRGIVRSVLDGVDELLSGLFREPPEAGWTKVVLNRDGTCAGCGREVLAGSEGFVRRLPDGVEVRCVQCGAGT